MIKFLSTIGGILISAVGFLYYLMTNSNFVPKDANGNYAIVNIVFLGFLLFLIICCIAVLLILAIRRVFLKSSETRVDIRFSMKYGVLLAIGIFAVYVLHFFHILSFLWGIAILIVVIVSLFVI